MPLGGAKDEHFSCFYSPYQWGLSSKNDDAIQNSITRERPHLAPHSITLKLIMVCSLGFPLSQDFSNFQVPGLLDFFSPGTLRVCRSCPVYSRDLGPLVLGCPGTYLEGCLRNLFAKINQKTYVLYFCKFFVCKIISFWLWTLIMTLICEP
jgi:hypothetical protein